MSIEQARYSTGLNVLGNYGLIRFVDCMDELGKSANRNLYDCCITDPPYGIGYISKRSKFRSSRPIKGDINGKWYQWIRALSNAMKYSSAIFLFTRWDVLYYWQDLLRKADFETKNILVWVKNVGTAGDLRGNWGYRHEFIIYATRGSVPIVGKRLDNVIIMDKIPAGTYQHPTPKPAGLLKPYLESLNVQCVIDPFAGTGGLLCDAEELGIHWIGYEIDDTYIDEARLRIENAKRVARVKSRGIL